MDICAPKQESSLIFIKNFPHTLNVDLSAEQSKERAHLWRDPTVSQSQKKTSTKLKNQINSPTSRLRDVDHRLRYFSLVQN
jgi:hypothetical protein